MSSLLLHGVLRHGGGGSCGRCLAPRLRGCVRVLPLPAAAAVSSAAAALAVAALAVAVAASRALLGQRGHRGEASPLRPHHHHAYA